MPLIPQAQQEAAAKEMEPYNKLKIGPDMPRPEIEGRGTVGKWLKCRFVTDTLTLWLKSFLSLSFRWLHAQGIA